MEGLLQFGYCAVINAGVGMKYISACGSLSLGYWGAWRMFSMVYMDAVFELAVHKQYRKIY